MDWAGDGAGGHLTAIPESGSSEEEEDEEAAPGQQHSPLSPEPGDAEARLAQLERASQALLAEMAALETEVELEQQSRQRAEAFTARVTAGTAPKKCPLEGTEVPGQPQGTSGSGSAGGTLGLGFWNSGIQVEQKNTRLERLSLALTPEVTPEVTPEEVTSEVTTEVTPAQRSRQQLPDPQTDLSRLLEQQQHLTAQVQHLQTQLELEQEERQRLRAALGASQRALRSFKRVSQIVTQDYCEALEQLELEQDLRLHAEAFAHEMLVQQKEANRQSSILLRSSGPDSRLLEALQELGKLSRELEETRREQALRVKELEEQLELRPEPEELQRARAALEEAQEEKLELRKRLEELEKEVGSLRERLAQESPLQGHPAPPPPPPPLPPPAAAVPADPLAALRQRKNREQRAERCPQRGDSRGGDPGAEDVRARAVQEMMERIRCGIVLRPARDRPHLRQDSVASKRRSAALELQGILGAMRRPSRRRCSGKSQSSGKRQDGQLESILQRRRRAVDAAVGNSTGNSAGNSAGNSEGNSEGNSTGNSTGNSAGNSTGNSTANSAGTPAQERDGAARWLDTGIQDKDTAGSRDSVPFRPRGVGGLPRTRPQPRLAWDSGNTA